MFSLTLQSKGHSQKLFHLRKLKEMTPSIRTLIDESKNVILAKVEVEYQHNSTLKESLPQLVNQDSKSNVKDQLHSF